MNRRRFRQAALILLAALAPLGCQPSAIDQTTTPTPAPSPISLPNAAIAAGSSHAAAVAQDGSVWAWGDNDQGELGLEGGDRPGPAKLNVPAAMGVSASEDGSVLEPGGHTLVLTRDRTLYTFGDNDHGQLGAAGDDRRTPALLAGLEQIVQVSAGADFSVAVREDGTAWAWGRDAFGQLGDGDSEEVSREAPVQVAGVQDFQMVSAGRYHTLGLRRDGSVVAWGDNATGVLGDGTLETRREPVAVRHLTEVVQVAAGDEFSLALKRDGTVWAWGDNDHGTLGDPALPRTDEVKEPRQVSGLGDIVAVAAGAHHALALKRDGTVWAWGANHHGELGNGEGGFGRFVPEPVRVVDLDQVALIAAGEGFSLAARADGTVWAWGENSSGQLGIGAADLEAHPRPKAVLGPEGQGQLKLVP